MALAWDDLDLDYDQADEDKWWAALAAEPPVGSWVGILERAAAARPRWQKRAACAGLDPNLFFPERGESVGEAQAVCARCPVIGPCGQFALANSERFGIWGGASERGAGPGRRTGRGAPTGGDSGPHGALMARHVEKYRETT